MVVLAVVLHLAQLTSAWPAVLLQRLDVALPPLIGGSAKFHWGSSVSLQDFLCSCSCT